MTGIHIATLKDRLLERDLELVRSTSQYRLLTTRQIQRLHFDHLHPTQMAAARACNRALIRLRGLGVLRSLDRRIGGARAGSAGFVWHLGPAGDGLLRELVGRSRSGRRNYREPSHRFVAHTLAVAETAVEVTVAARRGDLELLAVDTEPASWQSSLSPHGSVQWLKPDLRLVTATGDYEHHWFVEIDLDSEHLPVIRRQCLAYQAHRATGRYQAEHELYPAVVWIVPTERRRAQLQAGLAADKQLNSLLFTVVLADQMLDLLRAGAANFTKDSGGQEGGTPS